MTVVLDIVGSILGFPLLWLGYVLATISEGFTRAACWLMKLPFHDEEDED
jgi:hypothetical protein